MPASNIAEIIEPEFIPLAVIEGLSHSREEVERITPPIDPPPGSGFLPDIIDGDRFLEIIYPPRPELIKGLLHQGAKLLLAGASKAGKTWLLVALAIAVATGEPWLGLPTKKARVLYVNLEILPDFFQQRCKMVRDAMGMKSVGLLTVWNLRGYQTEISAMVDIILAQMEKAGGYDLVIVDPIYKCYGQRDESNAGDMADFLFHLERISARTGAAVAFSAHYSKGNQAAKSVLDRASGSGVFARDADSYVSLTEHELEDHFSVEAVVRNVPVIPSFVVRKEFPLFVRDDTLDPTKLKTARRKAKASAPAPAAATASAPVAPAPVGRKPKFTDDALLSLLPPDGLTFSQWGKSATMILGSSETTFKERRRALLEKGAVVLQDDRYVRAATA